MIVLGIGRDVHDPSAALVADGEILAAAEEERFTRVKHAPGTPPIRAARFCLEAAGVSPGDVDLVAYPWSLETYRRNRWIYARRILPTLPRHALNAVLRTGPRWAREMAAARRVLEALGLPEGRASFVPVPHHLAHAASCWYPSGYERALVLTADAMGEFDTAGAWIAQGPRLEKTFELLMPDSLGTFYTAVTEYLGFEPNDGEYKTMGMAAFGDARRVDLSRLCRRRGFVPEVDPLAVFPPRAYRSRGRFYGDRMVEILGPPGDGAHAHAPWTDVAAAAQEFVEETVLAWIRGPLALPLERGDRSLCFAGGLALNVKLNGRILEETEVERLWVQPAAGDAGGALGAALWAAQSAGDRVRPMPHAFLGPAFPEGALRDLLSIRRLPFERPADLPGTVARLLHGGAVVGRFDGAMEWGPRALGNRSILAHPGLPGTADRVNQAVKFREPWRPFCPSVLETRAAEVFSGAVPSPYMTVNFRVAPGWRSRIAEVSHRDGTARIQTVDAARAPGLAAILTSFEALTGLPVLLNTSLNRRGEPVACTPADALEIFYGSGLDALVLGPFLVRKARD